MDPYTRFDGQDEGMDRRAMLSQMGGAPRSAPTPAGAAVRFDPAAQGGAVPRALPQQAAAPAQANAALGSPYQSKGTAMGLQGFDAGKLSGGHVSPKYVFARAAQGLGMGDQDELLRRLKADSNGYFSNAEFFGSKNDKLRINGDLDPKFEGYSVFDVIKAAGKGGEGWQWGAEGPGNSGAAHAMAPGLQPARDAAHSPSILPDQDQQSSVFQKIMAQLAAQQQPQSPDDDAIRALLAGGRA